MPHFGISILPLWKSFVFLHFLCQTAHVNDWRELEQRVSRCSSSASQWILAFSCKWIKHGKCKRKIHSNKIIILIIIIMDINRHPSVAKMAYMDITAVSK